MPYRYDDIDLQKVIASIPPEILEELQRRDEEKTQKDFEDLRDGLTRNECYLCKKSIDDIDPTQPCLHWLISDTVKKKDLLRMLNSISLGIVSIYTYLTWVANSERPFVNINNLQEDIIGTRMFEATVRYKHFEWSFSLSKTDFEGHDGAQAGKEPHFHLQILKNGYVFLKFNDTHIKLSSNDFYYIEMVRQDVMEIDASFSSGLNEFVQMHDEISSNLHPSTDGSKDFYTRTLIDVTSVTDEMLDEICALKQSDNLTTGNAIERLNKEKGYDIKYKQMTVPINAVEMKHRN